MSSFGVDGAVIVSTLNLYRYDPSYALEVYAKYPERFRVVKPIDPTDPAVHDVVADWAKTKGAVGVRLMLREEQIADPADPRLAARSPPPDGMASPSISSARGASMTAPKWSDEIRTPSSSSTISG